LEIAATYPQTLPVARPQIKTYPQAMESAEHKADMTPNVEETKQVLESERTSTPEEERAVVRKIDMVVLPLMCFVFFLQYLDKQSLSYAAVRRIVDQ
jgi:hypothetical protein